MVGPGRVGEGAYGEDFAFAIVYVETRTQSKFIEYCFNSGHVRGGISLEYEHRRRKGMCASAHARGHGSGLSKLF